MSVCFEVHLRVNQISLCLWIYRSLIPILDYSVGGGHGLSEIFIPEIICWSVRTRRWSSQAAGAKVQFKLVPLVVEAKKRQIDPQN